VSRVSNTRRETCCFRGVHACIIAAAVLGAIDYKRTFARTYTSEEERFEAYSQCHLRSAKRVLRALLANGGKSVIIRHTEEGFETNFMSRGIHKVRATHGISVSYPTLDLFGGRVHSKDSFVLPLEWTSTMRPLQDKCDPTPYEDVNALFVSDMGQPLSEIFDYFNPEPIGVASLAQVHIAHHRESGKTVAVKVSWSDNAYLFTSILIIVAATSWFT
jgi:aarF domain-containing kinase